MILIMYRGAIHELVSIYKSFIKLYAITIKDKYEWNMEKL